MHIGNFSKLLVLFVYSEFYVVHDIYSYKFIFFLKELKYF